MLISCVTTKRTYKEFELFRFSMEQFYSNVKWLLSCDEWIKDRYSQLTNIECFVWVDKSGTHENNPSLEDQDNFHKLILTKMDLINESIDRVGYGLLFDSDMLITNYFEDEFFRLLTSNDCDIVASKHRLKVGKENLEKRVGIYNVGMMIVKNKEFTNKWKRITETKQHFYEQKPFEIAAQDYRVKEMSIPYNLAEWRLDNFMGIKENLTLSNGLLCIQEFPVYNVHSHFFNSNGYPPADAYSRQVLEFLKMSGNNKYHAMLMKYGELRNESV